MGPTLGNYLILLSLIASNVILSAQTIPTEWQLINPHPIGGELSSITFGNGVFVVVDRSGAMLTSSDGVSWTNTPVAPWLRDIAFGEGMYVAVGGPPSGVGRVFTSRNAVNWVKRSFTGERLKGVAYGNGMFVAIGDGAIYMSQNGVRWQSVRSLRHATLDDIAFGNGKFLAIGTSTSTGVPLGIVFHSRTGTHWNGETYSGIEPWKNLSFAGGQFHARSPWGSVFSSTNGRSWTNTVTGAYDKLAAGQGYLRGVPDDRFYDTPNARIHDIAYGNERFVAVGPRGAVAMALALAPTNYNSRWINVSGVSDHDLIDVEYGNGMYLAVSAGAMIMGSRTGAEWTRHWLGLSGNPSSFGFTALAYGNGVFVAVTHTTQFIASSPDGTSWTRRGNRTVGSDGFMDVAFGNGMFMAVGHTSTREYGIIRTSHDGATWGWVGGDIYLYGRFLRVDFDGTYFVVTRKDGSLMYTTDAQTWFQSRPYEDWEWPTRSFDTPHGKVNAWTTGPSGTVAVGEGCLILHAPHPQ